MKISETETKYIVARDYIVKLLAGELPDSKESNQKYLQARKIVADCMAGKFPVLQNRYPNQDLGELFVTLDDETLLKLGSGALELAEIYATLNRNMMRLKKSKDIDRFTSVSINPESDSDTNITESPNTEDHYVNKGVEEMLRGTKNETRATYRPSSVRAQKSSITRRGRNAHE